MIWMRVLWFLVVVVFTPNRDIQGGVAIGPLLSGVDGHRVCPGFVDGRPSVHGADTYIFASLYKYVSFEMQEPLFTTCLQALVQRGIYTTHS